MLRKISELGLVEFRDYRDDGLWKIGAVGSESWKFINLLNLGAEGYGISY